MKLKRLLAYFVDILIVYIIANLIFMVAFKNDYDKYMESSEKFLENLTNTVKDSKNNEDIIKNTNKISYEYLKSGTTNTIIVVAIEIIYFVFIQYFLDGKTLGKKLTKIKVAPVNGEKLNAGLFVLREAVLFTIPIKIIDIICLLSTKMNTYLNINNVLSNINMIITIAIVATILFREDERGLHDLVGKTKVISLSKERK